MSILTERSGVTLVRQIGMPHTQPHYPDSHLFWLYDGQNSVGSVKVSRRRNTVLVDCRGCIQFKSQVYARLALHALCAYALDKLSCSAVTVLTSNGRPSMKIMKSLGFKHKRNIGRIRYYAKR